MPFEYLLLIFVLIFLLVLVIKIYLLNKDYTEMYETNSYNKIFDNLYLGNIDSARDLEFIKKKNIKYIFNISNGIPNYFEYNKDIIYINLYIVKYMFLLKYIMHRPTLCSTQHLTPLEVP